MVPPKKKSKRVPVRLRHKIEKKVVAKAKKERKHAKKHPELNQKKKPEKLNIPNSFPYKDRLLAEIEQERTRKEEERLRRIEEARQKKREANGAAELGMGVEEEEEQMAGLSDDEVDSGSEGDEMEEDAAPVTGNSAMAALLASAQARAKEFEGQEDSDDDEMDQDSDDGYGHLLPDDNDDGESRANATRKDTSRKAFDKMFKTVLDAADVILYVLDARDPNGTRSRAIERQIMAAEGGEKRLILILNKIDLVPPNVLKAWLVYLRRYFPTLPLKATTAAANATTFDHKALTMQGTSTTLFKALKSYANSKQLKRSISVGVIGYPNVGKSSVINALTSRVGGTMSACPVGAEAGVTTSLREVKLDKKLKIIDSPGIVFPGNNPDGNSTTGGKKVNKVDEAARLILINAVPPKQILDPVPAVTLLLKRLSTSKELFNKMLSVYNIPPLLAISPSDLTNDFLVQVARKRGRLGKGGVPNINSAALCVITDWRDGRIQGWVEPPIATPAIGAQQSTQGIKSEDAGAVVADQKEIVTEWAKEFKLEGLWGDGEDGGYEEENGGMVVD